jgi:hypothetical protein
VKIEYTCTPVCIHGKKGVNAADFLEWAYMRKICARAWGAAQGWQYQQNRALDLIFFAWFSWSVRDLVRTSSAKNDVKKT